MALEFVWIAVVDDLFRQQQKCSSNNGSSWCVVHIFVSLCVAKYVNLAAQFVFLTTHSATWPNKNYIDNLLKLNIYFFSFIILIFALVRELNNWIFQSNTIQQHYTELEFNFKVFQLCVLCGQNIFIFFLKIFFNLEKKKFKMYLSKRSISSYSYCS